MNSYHVRLIAQTKTTPVDRVKSVRVDRWRPDQVSDLLEQTVPLMVTAIAGLFLTAAEHPTRHRKTQTPQRGVIYARTQNSSRNDSIASGPGSGASGSGSNHHRHRRSTRLCVRLLRL